MTVALTDGEITELLDSLSELVAAETTMAKVSYGEFRERGKRTFTARIWRRHDRVGYERVQRARALLKRHGRA